MHITKFWLFMRQGTGNLEVAVAHAPLSELIDIQRQCDRSWKRMRRLLWIPQDRKSPRFAIRSTVTMRSPLDHLPSSKDPSCGRAGIFTEGD